MTKSSKSLKSSKSTTNRPKPLVAKAGVTKNRDRRYCNGGKLKK